jgi:aminoglycoside 6-adenylyltransferase
LGNSAEHDETIRRLIQWAEQQPLVRAMILTSSHAVPGAPVDLLSDYDVILVLSDILPFHESRAWLAAFGRVLALYRDPLESGDGFIKSGYVIQFEAGLKIDFSLWPVGFMQKVAAAAQLQPEFDAGYRILLDKDGLTAGLGAPTYRAYIPTPPSEARYQETIENFFLDTTYVTKLLWRDDLMAAKHLLDHFIKHEHLLPMLEWHIELAHGWNVKPGPYGRRLKRWLRPDLWADLEATYTGPGMAENWEALFKSIDLMRKVAAEVGEGLGYTYPDDLERRVVAYLLKLKDLEPGADHF